MYTTEPKPRSRAKSVSGWLREEAQASRTTFEFGRANFLETVAVLVLPNVVIGKKMQKPMLKLLVSLSQSHSGKWEMSMGIAQAVTLLNSYRE